MEDVWSELSLSSHVRRSADGSTATSSSQGAPLSAVRLQEFLHRPLHPAPESCKTGRTGQQTMTGTQVLCFGNPNGGTSGDDLDAVSRKKIRLMKNRESAVRSRARKQAYTSELELEVERLAKENDKLRKQLEDIREEKNKANVYEALQQRKTQLQRSMTAPF